MTLRIGINGFGRIGRGVFRAACERDGMEIVRINDPGARAEDAAYLVNHDSISGRWSRQLQGADGVLSLDGRDIPLGDAASPEQGDWSGVDLVLECSGRFKSAALLQPYLDAGVGHVVVSAPVGDAEVPNIVVGVNDGAFDPQRQQLVSGASCTTNCVAPVLAVIHEHFGVVRGSINTIHAVTAGQAVMDGFNKDVRRGRAAFASLIPTTTGAARAIGRIFPDLDGHLSGVAVRVPVLCPSLTDITLELGVATDAEAVNAALQAASGGALAGVLGVEHEPLVSIDYVGDPRSSIVDAPSTFVVDGHHLKVLAWYDNETGYSLRLLDLVERIRAGS